MVRTIYDRPLIEAQPSMRDSTTPGIRSILWRSDEPATLVLVQALDDGDPRKSVPKRDRVSLLKAPFSGEPQPFVETEFRYGGIQWLSPTLAMLSEFSQQRTRARMWMIDPSAPESTRTGNEPEDWLTMRSSTKSPSTSPSPLTEAPKW